MRATTSAATSSGLGTVAIGTTYAALLIAAFVNGSVQEAVIYVNVHGVSKGLWDTFGLSAILFVGLGSAVYCLLRAPAQLLTRLDWVVVSIAMLLLMLPLSEPSWVALTVIALRLSLDRRLDPHLRAAGTIVATLAAAAFWCRLSLLLFANQLLTLDAMFVSGLLGLERDGNLLKVDESFIISIQRGCSSLQGASFALLCWISIYRLRDPFPKFRDFVPAIVVIVLAVVVNLLRLTVMSQGPGWFELAHGDTGAMVASSAILALAAAVAVFWRGRGARSQSA